MWFCKRRPKVTSQAVTTATTTTEETINTEDQRSCCGSIYTLRNEMRDRVFISSCCNKVNIKEEEIPPPRSVSLSQG